MEHNNLKTILSVLMSIIVLLITGCSKREINEMIPVGPDVKADFVIFFKTGTSDAEIYKFVTETISTPVERGYKSLPGIRDVLQLRPIDGHEGYAITFFPDAPERQRDYVKAIIKSSTIVYRVLENVVPGEIKKID
jgi:hypothetical protein